MGTALAFLSSWFGSLLFLRDEGMFYGVTNINSLYFSASVVSCWSMSSHRVCCFSLLGNLKQKGATRYGFTTCKLCSPQRYVPLFSSRGFGSPFETQLHFILLSWCKMIFFKQKCSLAYCQNMLLLLLSVMQMPELKVPGLYQEC